MNHKEFLKQYPLEYSWPEPCAELMRQVLEKAFESHGITYIEQPDVVVSDVQYYSFAITGYTTNFAAAYAHIGWLVRDKVYPAWKKFNKAKSSKTILREVG